MRISNLFMSTAVAMAFIGCSSEDDPINKGGENTDDGYGYVAVNIVEPKPIGSRANESGNFQNGTDAENNASTGLFFIYNPDGTTMYSNPQTIDLTNGDGTTSNNPYVEKIYKSVLIVDGIKDKPGTENFQIVCVLNAPDDLKSHRGTLAELKGKIADYGTHDDGTFIMTNSVYTDGTPAAEVCGAIITNEKLKKSATAALNDPVEIYVERVVARIQAKSDALFDNQGAKPAIDGTETKLKIKVTGIEVANIAEKSYLFKNITGFDASITWTWSDATNKRSYWETVPATTGDNALTFGNKSYTNIATDDNFDITKVTDFKEYVQPNTNADQKTSILVTAELQNEDGSAADLAYIRGGYTTKQGAKNIILTYLQNQGYGKLVAGSSPARYTPIESDDIEWKNNEDLEDADKIEWLERYEVVARVKSDVANLYKNVNSSPAAVDVAEINSDLAGNSTSHPYVARLYGPDEANAKCMCYYFVNIDHTPVATDNGYVGDGKFEGVIRNHIYDLTLNSISGVGTPVFDPDDVIIPETPEDESLWFLGARVNVLKWRIVKQNIDFTGK